MRAGKMAEASFSEDGKFFCAISQDGRLRIWDTETNVLKQEYTPDLHLTSPPSCLQWISVTQSTGQSQKGGKRKSSVSEQEIQCIALGTTSGKIVIYSVAQAKVETVLLVDKNSEGQKKSVTALDWHRNYGLYSCNKENYVQEWNLQKATVSNKYNVNVDSKNKQANFTSAIKIVPHSKKTLSKFLITASWQIRVWRLHNGQADIVKCLGHNTSSKALLSVATLNNSCWLIEGSQTERLLSFWDVTITDDQLPQLNGEENTPNKKKRRKSTSAPAVVNTPTYNFVLEDAPRLLDVDVREENGGTKLGLAAVTRSGVVHYYGHMLNGASSKPIKPSVTIQVTTADAQPLPLQCCRSLDSGDVTLGYTRGPALLFEKVTPDTKSKTQVLIRSEGKQSKKKKQAQEANKTRADASIDNVTLVEPMGGVSRKRPTVGGKVEVPMEERLANLTVDLKSRGQAAVSHNMTKLLVQGLHSKEQRLIQSVLQTNKSSVAAQTVSHLPAQYVPALLEELANMASQRTSDCACVCTWLNAVVRCHAALLLASITAAPASPLLRLLATLTHRRSHLCQLLNLKGRLELTMTQREAREQQPLDQQAVLDYNDTSSDEEMEVDRQSDSEAPSWHEESDNNSADSDSDSGGE